MFFAFNQDFFKGKLSDRDKSTIARLYAESPEEIAKRQNEKNTESAAPSAEIAKALELNKKAAELFSQGQIDSAISNLEQAIQLTPGLRTVQENLARALLKRADQQSVKQNYLSAEKDLKAAADLFIKAKNFSEAKSVLRDLASLARIQNRNSDEESYLRQERELDSGQQRQ